MSIICRNASRSCFLWRKENSKQETDDIYVHIALNNFNYKDKFEQFRRRVRLRSWSHGKEQGQTAML